MKKTTTQLDQYATKGLRTLVLGKRIIDHDIYATWVQKYNVHIPLTNNNMFICYQEASCLLENREQSMQNLQAEIEIELIMVGATAIEDKLQDDVGYTIHKLKEAGIKVWVLTGDKVETAINIGYSCQLLNDDLIKLEITEIQEDEIRRKIDTILDDVNSYICTYR